MKPKLEQQQLQQREVLDLAYGTTYLNQSVYFKVTAKNSEQCDLLLYHHSDPLKNQRVHMDKLIGSESVFYTVLSHFPYSLYDYSFEAKGIEFIEENAKVVRRRKEFGHREVNEKLCGGFLADDSDYEIDEKIQRPYHEMILYELHVRGFTQHESSGVTHRGTYKGIVEKIPYLLELGVNTLLMMPITEFDELSTKQTYHSKKEKINYWGYGCECYYYAPKTAYASDQTQPDLEVKQMVYELHKHGIEVILQMNFDQNVSPITIADCLKYWHKNYHIDGFRLNLPEQYRSMIAADPILRDVKLLDNGWNISEIMNFTGGIIPKWLAEFHDGFKVDVRRFLKGDEGQVSPFLERAKYIPEHTAVINYISNHDGFTLHDLYTYDIKHNELNEENNQDGSEYNFSWNCGTEGETKRAKINELRMKMYQNALFTLLLAQGTPLLLAGDEFGNTQDGNNNVYCQDNEISWLDWSKLSQNRELHDYVINLIDLRKSHPILHPEKQLRGMDYIYCGIPDLSFHSTKVWQLDTSYYRRELGILICGKYIQLGRREQDRTFYFLYNMYWEAKIFDLPKPIDQMKWSLLLATDTNVYNKNEFASSKDYVLQDQRKLVLPPKTICVLMAL